MSRSAKAAKALRSRTRARLYVEDTILERLPQDLQDMAAEHRQFIQKQHAMMRQRHFPGRRYVAAADQPHIRDGVMGARPERVVTKAVRALVRPATRWMQVVSRASGSVMASRMVVSRRARLDVLAPGHPV
jgi:hypothetical protein